jgi:hypothetical protein
MELVDEWKKNKEVWCDTSSNKASDSGPQIPSKLTCYPYHQVKLLCNRLLFFLHKSRKYVCLYGLSPALCELNFNMIRLSRCLYYCCYCCYYHFKIIIVSITSVAIVTVITAAVVIVTLKIINNILIDLTFN